MNQSKRHIYFLILPIFTVAFFSLFLCIHAVEADEIYDAAPSVPNLTTAKAVSQASIRLKWKPTSKADGYLIYRSTSQTDVFSCIYTYNDGGEIGTAIKYDDANLDIGTTYYYKVQAFVTNGDETVYSDFTPAMSATATLKKVKITKAVSKKKKQNTIRWKKVSEADGYYVYYSTKRKGEYTKLKKIKNNSTHKFVHKKLNNGSAYYYKVYSYKIVNGKTIKSIEPDPYLKYCDFYSSSSDTWEQRRQRVFGKKNKSWYKSQKQAEKNMKTIKVKVWDENTNGKKYTRTFSLTVNKGLAKSMKAMFQEIYNSPEKFPIHDIGCYNWRGDSSSSEHCIGTAIDINANENYMIDDGIILAGSFWKPKKNKYSIPLKCELVDILERYGFSRGFWGDRKDYMHFSYFGT